MLQRKRTDMSDRAALQSAKPHSAARCGLPFTSLHRLYMDAQRDNGSFGQGRLHIRRDSEKIALPPVGHEAASNVLLPVYQLHN